MGFYKALLPLLPNPKLKRDTKMKLYRRDNDPRIGLRTRYGRKN
jgi:hypothetical protein